MDKTRSLACHARVICSALSFTTVISLVPEAAGLSILETSLFTTNKVAFTIIVIITVALTLKAAFHVAFAATAASTLALHCDVGQGIQVDVDVLGYPGIHLLQDLQVGQLTQVAACVVAANKNEKV